MNPETSLDLRYSDPDAVATGWDETRRLLETAEMFWLATVRADGRPHVTPLVAVWVNDALHFASGAGEQKTRNLATNPHVTLTTGGDRWDSGFDVVVEGEAGRVTDDDSLQRLAAAWTAKWDGRWHYVVSDGCFYHGRDGDRADAVHVFAAVPAKVLVFGKGEFSQTTHSF
jgi:nitroimidazol reductase NimA-like FMN-containing flavoprotein (pyridoxamine 5'-phosphate oxidase superfamily)